MGKSPVICESMGIVKQNIISESGRIVKFHFLFPLPNFSLGFETKRRGLREDRLAYSILRYEMYARILLLSPFISLLVILCWAQPMWSCSREDFCVVPTRPVLRIHGGLKFPFLYPLPNFPLKFETKRLGLRQDCWAYFSLLFFLCLGLSAEPTIYGLVLGRIFV